MLNSAEAYSFRQKSRLAISLSWIGGYTNIVALLITNHVVSHVTVSHMTGNTTIFSSAIAAGNWKYASEIGSVIGSFFLGAILSSFITETARRHGVPSKYVLPMAVEAILLALLGVWLACSTAPGAISGAGVRLRGRRGDGSAECHNHAYLRRRNSHDARHGRHH